MYTDQNGLKHSWLAFSLRLGLSIIGFVSAVTPCDHVTLDIGGRTFLWKTERPAVGRIVRPGQQPDCLSVENKEFYHLTPSCLKLGNTVTEIVADENERDFLLHATVHNDGSALFKPELNGFIQGRVPKSIVVSDRGFSQPSTNTPPWLMTTKVKIVNEDNQISEHYVATENHATETRVIDVLPASRGLRGYHGFHHFREVRLMEATAYYPGPECTGKYAARGLTYTGKKAGYGFVAVDPNVIPLGTRLYIEGYGEAEAADIGGAIKGNIVDLCFETYQEAVNYGRKRIKVYLLE